MNKSKVLTFFGSGSLAAASLNYLCSKYNVGAIVTKAKATHHKDPAPVEELANAKGIPVYFANNATELNELYDKSNIETECGIVIDYGVIITQHVISKFKLGIINSHFSLLPEWRGADPITYSLLSGQNTTGVSLMLIDKGLDTGKLISQEKIKIDTDENNRSLSLKLIGLSNNLLSKNLEKYLSGELVPYRQEILPVTYSNKIVKSNGVIDWNKPSTVLEREIRAFNQWPGSFFMLNDIRLTVTKAEATDDYADPGQISVTTDKISIGCRVGSLLILEVKPDGKNNMAIKSFINGYSFKIL